MPQAQPYVLRIDSEASAWEALQWLIVNRREAKDASLSIGDLGWTQFHLNYKGRVFSQTVTPTIMKGMVEYQNNLHRSVALLLKSDDRITRLTDIEKSSTELVFKVEEGSSDFTAGGDALLESLKSAFEKMTGRQILLGAVVLMVLYFGSGNVDSYIVHKTEEKKIEAELKGRAFDASERQDLYEFLGEIVGERSDRNKILERAYKASPTAAAIGDHNRNGIDELIRNAGDAEQLTIQDRSVNAKVINEVRRSTRSTSENVVIKELFRVVGVESIEADSFIVTLESKDTGEIIVSLLEDPVVIAKGQKAIQRSEWSNTFIMVHMTGRRVNGVIKDANITRAYTPRKTR